jgi:hypothetical protein
VGPPGQLVEGGLAGGGQLVGHAGDQLADPVADRAAAHGDRPVRALPAAIGGGRVPAASSARSRALSRRMDSEAASGSTAASTAAMICGSVRAPAG